MNAWQDIESEDGAHPSDRALSPSATEPLFGVSAHSGDDPLRTAALTVAEDTYSPFWRDAIVGQILDIQERENESRADFKPAISRAMVERAISQLLGIYDCRSSDLAAAYGWTGLWDILGVDWRKLTFVDRDRDGNPKGGDSEAAPCEA